MIILFSSQNHPGIDRHQIHARARTGDRLNASSSHEVFTMLKKKQTRVGFVHTLWWVTDVSRCARYIFPHDIETWIDNLIIHQMIVPKKKKKQSTSIRLIHKKNVLEKLYFYTRSYVWIGFWKIYNSFGSSSDEDFIGRVMSFVLPVLSPNRTSKLCQIRITCDSCCVLFSTDTSISQKWKDTRVVHSGVQHSTNDHSHYHPLNRNLCLLSNWQWFDMITDPATKFKSKNVKSMFNFHVTVPTLRSNNHAFSQDDAISDYTNQYRKIHDIGKQIIVHLTKFRTTLHPSLQNLDIFFRRSSFVGMNRRRQLSFSICRHNYAVVWDVFPFFFRVNDIDSSGSNVKRAMLNTSHQTGDTRNKFKSLYSPVYIQSVSYSIAGGSSSVVMARVFDLRQFHKWCQSQLHSSTSHVDFFIDENVSDLLPRELCQNVLSYMCTDTRTIDHSVPRYIIQNFLIWSILSFPILQHECQGESDKLPE